MLTLQQLQERHEALAQTVELIARNMVELQLMTKHNTGLMRDLLAVAGMHETWISKLESHA